MRRKIDNIILYLRRGMWQTRREEVSPLVFVLLTILRRLVVTVKFFTTRSVTDMASALTYSTLLAIVPILAVVFAIARGFGFSKYIEIWFRDALSSQPQAADTIIGFVNSYLVHTKSGIFLGIGLLFMLFTVLMLISNIEKAFNKIWQVQHPRSLFRTVTDYLAMFFLVPIIIVVTSGVSIVMATFASDIEEYVVIGPMMRLFISVMPYVLMSAVFVGFYIFMPNTKVNFSAAFFPGILSGVAMQVLQVFYIHSQIFLSSYNAIYGSFAALPLFMLWVQISWSICLFGAELSYTSQNMESFDLLGQMDELSYRYRMMLSALLLGKICRRFDEAKPPYTAVELKLETNIPVRIVQQLLFEMQTAGLVTYIAGDEKDVDARYQPALSLRQLTLGLMIDRLESSGTWNLDLDIGKHLTGRGWKEFYRMRKHYLAEMRTIELKDLVFDEQPIGAGLLNTRH